MGNAKQIHAKRPEDLPNTMPPTERRLQASLELLPDHKMLCGPGFLSPICSAKSPFFATRY